MCVHQDVILVFEQKACEPKFLLFCTFSGRHGHHHSTQTFLRLHLAPGQEASATADPYAGIHLLHNTLSFVPPDLSDVRCFALERQTVGALDVVFEDELAKELAHIPEEVVWKRLDWQPLPVDPHADECPPLGRPYVVCGIHQDFTPMRVDSRKMQDEVVCVPAAKKARFDLASDMSDASEDEGEDDIVAALVELHRAGNEVIPEPKPKRKKNPSSLEEQLEEIMEYDAFVAELEATHSKTDCPDIDDGDEEEPAANDDRVEPWRQRFAEPRPGVYTTPPPEACPIGKLDWVTAVSIKMTCRIHRASESRGKQCSCWIGLKNSNRAAQVETDLEQWLVNGLDMGYDAHENASQSLKQSHGMKLR